VVFGTVAADAGSRRAGQRRTVARGRAAAAVRGRRPGDDLVPVIANFEFLTEDDKMTIFHDNPGHVCPGLGELGHS
jgi:hypothetical protein